LPEPTVLSTRIEAETYRRRLFRCIAQLDWNSMIPQLRSQPSHEQRSLHPHSAHPEDDNKHLSRPVEDCAECPALAGVRKLALNDPSPDRPDSHCNFGGVTLGGEVVRELTIGVPG
jgi:hypothetical protein